MQIPQIRNDNLFHDLINQDNMSIIEWIVMIILGLSYEEVHGNCIVKNSRLTRTSKNDRNKYVDLIIGYLEYEIILELNNFFLGSLIRNIVYGMTRVVNFYQVNINNKEKKDYYKKKIKVIVINLNWYPKDKKINLPKKRMDKVFGFDDIKKGIFFKVINVILDKYAKIAYNKIDTNEKFYKLLTINNLKDLKEFTRDELLLTEYVDKLIKLSKDNKYEEDVMTETMEENLRNFELYSACEDIGYEKGIVQKQNELIMEMYQNGLSASEIKKYTNISLKVINKVISTIPKKIH
ncbi:MAG: hypothetical protein IJ068_06200 [Bacilli bacterium]|nr:hypothetical protein [Bacilli bacterium]